MEKVSARRLAALVYGLPPEAAAWRPDHVPPVEERLNLLLERQDKWNRAIIGALVHEQRIELPSPIEIPRPEPPHIDVPKKVITSAKEIAAWFGANG